MSPRQYDAEGPDGPADNAPPDTQHAPARTDEAGISLLEPFGAGAMACSLAEQINHPAAGSMLDGGIRSKLKFPTVAPETEAEIRVAARPHVVREPSHLLENRTSDHAVRGLCVRLAHLQRVRLIDQAPQPRVAAGDRLLLARSGPRIGDRADQKASARGRIHGQVAVDQIRRRKHIGIQKEEPGPAASGGTSVPGVVRRLALVRPEDSPGRRVGQSIHCTPASVVDDRERIARSQLETPQAFHYFRELPARPSKRDDHIDGVTHSVDPRPAPL